eukprot:COSAG04_NODE_1760_length_5665_cov_4.392203_3_plen_659_part_00
MCCAVHGNTCGEAQQTSYCLDHTSSSNFVFGLWPGPPERFDPTGHYDPNGGPQYQQVFEGSFWPRWGAGAEADLNIGDSEDADQVPRSDWPFLGHPGLNGYCRQGHTYQGTSGSSSICGGNDNWGATDVEVWYLDCGAAPCPPPPTPKPLPPPAPPPCGGCCEHADCYPGNYCISYSIPLIGEYGTCASCRGSFAGECSNHDCCSAEFLDQCPNDPFSCAGRSTCDTTADCLPGQYCDEAYRCAVGCRGDADCPADQHCSSSHHCVEECEGHADCPLNKYCLINNNCDSCSGSNDGGFCDEFAVDSDCCSAAFQHNCPGETQDCDFCANGCLQVSGSHVRTDENVDVHVDGAYARMESAQCNGKPVYQRSGESGDVLFQPTGKSYWLVGPSNHAETCDATGYIQSSGDCGFDATRCAGTWLSTAGCSDGDDWCPSPGLTVNTQCTDGCYTVRGAKLRNGVYARLGTARCNNRPVYQNIASADAYVLFQPTDTSYWLVGSSEHATNCENIGWIQSVPGCATRPDAAGCAGLWREYNGSHWQPVSGLTLTHKCNACFVVAGSRWADINAVYEPIATQCNGKPIYQEPTAKYILFQPVNGTDWWVGSIDQASDCKSLGFVVSTGSCPRTPAGAGCAGTWKETDSSAEWQDAPGLTVASQAG